MRHLPYHTCTRLIRLLLTRSLLLVFHRGLGRGQNITVAF